MAKTWETVRGELKIDDKDEAIVQIEKDLIRTMIKIREEQGLEGIHVEKTKVGPLLHGVHILNCCIRQYIHSLCGL